MQPVVYIGIDVSKARLDVATNIPVPRPRPSFPNHPRGIARLVEWVITLPPAFIVFEAGSYTRRLEDGLENARLRYARINPRIVRRYAGSGSGRAKCGWILRRRVERCCYPGN